MTRYIPKGCTNLNKERKMTDKQRFYKSAKKKGLQIVKDNPHLSLMAIARELGVSDVTLGKWVHDAGIKRAPYRLVRQKMDERKAIEAKSRKRYQMDNLILAETEEPGNDHYEISCAKVKIDAKTGIITIGIGNRSCLYHKSVIEDPNIIVLNGTTKVSIPAGTYSLYTK